MDQLSWNEQRKLNKAHAKKLTKEEKAQLKEVEVRSKKRKLKKEFETQKQAAFEENLTAKLRSLDKKKAQQVFKEEGSVLFPFSLFFFFFFFFSSPELCFCCCRKDAQEDPKGRSREEL
jgi:hypothetical protein